MKILTKQILCKYLPWKIRVKVEDDDVSILSFAPQTNRIIYECCYGVLDSDIKYIKLYLRPLSDLIKPIIVKGYNDDKEFVPMEHIAKLYNCTISNVVADTNICKFTYNEWANDGDFYLGWGNDWFYTFESMGGYEGIPLQFIPDDVLPFKLEILELLYQWHFDLYNGIKEGWAIDINELNK